MAWGEPKAGAGRWPDAWVPWLDAWVLRPRHSAAGLECHLSGEPGERESRQAGSLYSKF